MAERLLVQVYLVACFWVTIGSLRAEDIDSEFRRDGLARLAELESQLCQLQGSASIRTDRAGSEERFDFCLKNEWFRLITSPGAGDGPETILGRNSRYAFRIGRSSPSRPYLLQQCGKLAADDEVILQTGLLGESILAPVRVVGRPLKVWLANKDFAIRSATRTKVDGEFFVELTVIYTSDKDTHPPELPAFTGRLLLNPEKFWAIAKQSLTIERRHKGRVVATVPLETTIEFGANVGAYPTPRVVTHVIPSQSQNATLPRYRKTVTITSLQACNLPERDFTLSAFGLPEPPGMEWPNPMPYGWLSQREWSLSLAPLQLTG